jgi:hypothetical protein
VDDRGDLLECVFAVDAKPDECDFCAGASTERPHLSDLDVAANDFVAKPFDDDRDGCESGVSLAVSTTAGRRGQRWRRPPGRVDPTSYLGNERLALRPSLVAEQAVISVLPLGGVSERLGRPRPAVAGRPDRPARATTRPMRSSSLLCARSGSSGRAPDARQAVPIPAGGRGRRRRNSVPDPSVLAVLQPGENRSNLR